MVYLDPIKTSSWSVISTYFFRVGLSSLHVSHPLGSHYGECATIDRLVHSLIQLSFSRPDTGSRLSLLHLHHLLILSFLERY